MLDEMPVEEKTANPSPHKKVLMLLALGGLLGFLALIVYEAIVQSGIMKY
jgi:hypothetical protein